MYIIYQIFIIIYFLTYFKLLTIQKLINLDHITYYCAHFDCFAYYAIMLLCYTLAFFSSLHICNSSDSFNYKFLKICQSTNNQKTDKFRQFGLLLSLCYCVFVWYTPRFFLFTFVCNLSNSPNYKLSKISWPTNNRKADRCQLFGSLFNPFLFSGLLFDGLLLFGLGLLSGFCLAHFRNLAYCPACYFCFVWYMIFCLIFGYCQDCY